MSKTIKRSIILTVICCLTILYIFGGCNTLNPLYNDDIYVKLNGHQAKILIRERVHLMGSIAEIYYINGKEKILLGQVLAGDNGFCPFERGLYSVEVDDNKLTIEWCDKNRNTSDPSKWVNKTFDLPINTGDNK